MRDVLARPRIVERHGWSPEERLLFIAAFDESAIVVTPDAELRVVDEDPDDDRVLEAAITGGVDYIVSGDHHLVDLGEHAGIPIVTPARFVAALTVGLSIEAVMWHDATARRSGARTAIQGQAACRIECSPCSAPHRSVADPR